MTDTGDISGMGAAALRELGWAPRIFKSLRKAILFFERYSAKKGAVAIDLSRLTDPGNPVSQGQRDQDRATYDRLLLVFRALDPEVDNENLHFSLQTTMDFIGGTAGYTTMYLAERHGIEDERAYIRYVEFASRVLRRRMVARGLMRPIEHCDCGCGTEQDPEDG